MFASIPIFDCIMIVTMLSIFMFTLLWLLVKPSLSDKKKKVIKAILTHKMFAVLHTWTSILLGIIAAIVLSLTSDIHSKYREGNKPNPYLPKSIIDFYTHQHITKSNDRKNTHPTTIDFEKGVYQKGNPKNIHFILFIDNTGSDDNSNTFNKTHQENKAKLVYKINEGCANPLNADSCKLNELVFMDIFQNIVSSEKKDFDSISISCFNYFGNGDFKDLNETDEITNYKNAGKCESLLKIHRKIQHDNKSHPTTTSDFLDIFKKTKKILQPGCPTVIFIISDFIQDNYSKDFERTLKTYKDSIGDNIHQIILIDHPANNTQKQKLAKGEVKKIKEDIIKNFNNAYLYDMAIDSLSNTEPWESDLQFCSRFILNSKYTSTQTIYFYTPSENDHNKSNAYATIQFKQGGEYFFCLRSHSNENASGHLKATYADISNNSGLPELPKTFILNDLKSWNIISEPKKFLLTLENINNPDDVYVEIYKNDNQLKSIFKLHVNIKSIPLLPEDKSLLLIYSFFLLFTFTGTVLSSMSIEFLQQIKKGKTGLFFLQYIILKYIPLLIITYLLWSFAPLINLPYLHIIIMAFILILFLCYIFYSLHPFWKIKFSDIK